MDLGAIQAIFKRDQLLYDIVFMTEELSENQAQVPKPVQDELDVLDRVKRVAAKPRTKQKPKTDYHAAFLKLRDNLAQERLPEDRASILEQMERVAHLAAQRARHVSDSIDLNSPYFGHLRLRDDDTRKREVLIGKQTFIRDGVTVVDWRNAPISRVFYQSEQGDEYELSIDSKLTAGVVELRRTITISGGELRRVATPNTAFVHTEEGWLDVFESQPILSGGEGSAVRPDRSRPVLGTAGSVPTIGNQRHRVDKHLPEIASLLDSEQFELISSPDQGLIAISGSAGSGKTTVALHRVAFLAFKNPKRFPPGRSIVIVFSKALERYVSQILPALGVEGVRVVTFDAWASRLRRRHFPRLPSAYSETTPSAVSRFKLHSMLIPMLEEANERYPQMKPLELFNELLTNLGWLRELTGTHAPGVFAPEELTAIHRWCTRQHFNRVDKEGLTDDDQPCLDAEDDAILLRLYQLQTGPLKFSKKSPLRYAHLVVDEVQDLGPLELRVLLDTVAKDHPVTLAGDTAQKIIESSDFQDWSYVLRSLGLDHVEVSPLQIGYRSTAEVMKVAHEVLGPYAPRELPKAVRHGAPVELLRFASAGHAYTYLGEALRTLQIQEPLADLVVLFRYAAKAKECFEALTQFELPRLRLVLDHDFSFAPGVEVTTIEQVKGLEFDYVVVGDADSATFARTPLSRNLLHVAITRTAHQCWLLSTSSPSELLPDWLPIHEL